MVIHELFPNDSQNRLLCFTYHLEGRSWLGEQPSPRWTAMWSCTWNYCTWALAAYLGSQEVSLLLLSFCHVPWKDSPPFSPLVQTKEPNLYWLFLLASWCKKWYVCGNNLYFNHFFKMTVMTLCTSQGFYKNSFPPVFPSFLLYKCDFSPLSYLMLNFPESEPGMVI